MIQREISRALVLNLSGKASGATALPRIFLSLTAPSLLSRATPPNNGNYATAVVNLRTANDSITRVTPLMIMLTPTRTPIAQAELDGHCM